MEETYDVRSSEWKVYPTPHDLQDRRVEITGPVDRKMIINALNSGVKVFMADFEDSNSPTWDNIISGQINLRDAIKGTISFIDEKKGKEYKLTGKVYLPDGQTTDGWKIMTWTGADPVHDCYSPSVGGNCTPDEWREFSVEFTAESSSDGIYVFGIDGGTGTYTPGSNDIIYIADIVVTEVKEFIIPSAFKTDTSATIYTSDFSAGVDGWDATNANMNYYSYGPAGSAGVPDVGMFYGDDTEASHFISKTILTVGKKYRVTGRYHAVPSSSSSALGGIYIYDGWGHELKMLSTVDAWVDFDLEFVAESGSGSGSLNFYARNKSGGPTLTMAAGDYIYVEGIVVTEVKEFIIPNQYVDDSSYTSNYTKNYSHANATISRVGVSGVDEFLNDHLTSCTLNTSIDREAIGYVGHKLYSDRKPKVPVQTSLSFDTIVKNNISGSFLDNMKEGEDYNIVIDLKSTDDSTLAKYTLSGAKLDSLSYNSQVLTKRSASLNFSNYMDLENSSEGLFLEGKVTSASSDGDLIYPQF